LTGKTSHGSRHEEEKKGARSGVRERQNKWTDENKTSCLVNGSGRRRKTTDREKKTSNPTHGSAGNINQSVLNRFRRGGRRVRMRNFPQGVN